MVDCFMAANESRDIRCKSSAWIICTFSSDGEYDENDDVDDSMSDGNDTIMIVMQKRKICNQKRLILWLSKYDDYDDVDYYDNNLEDNDAFF